MRGVSNISAGCQPLKRIEGDNPVERLTCDGGNGTENENELLESDDEPSPDFQPTDEQQKIIDHVEYVSAGDVIRVSAMAGCGKTTTMALLCDALKENQGSTSDVLYVVFASDAVNEARCGMKFPKKWQS